MSTKPDDDLFATSAATSDYSAKDIEVLEGLEPVRRRPGMYIGGTDEKAFHHLAAEVLDNSMDEAVAGHASRIEIALAEDGSLTVRDNGRGIPVDAHPKFKNVSALEVILTTLHSGGKFEGKAYETSGGLHGVGISVVNALSDWLHVEVARDKTLWRQTYSRGKPTSRLENMGPVHNRRGTTISFHPDPQIFGDTLDFRPSRLYRLARSKAYLFRGVEIRWSCAASLLKGDDKTPEADTIHFPNGLLDFLNQEIEGADLVTPTPFAGTGELDGGGKVEWAIAWPTDRDGFFNSYCNTIPTVEGGTHESGLRNALVKGLKGYAELAGNRKAGQITAEDVLANIAATLSVFIREPLFQGQTKERLSSPEATRLVEAAVRDHFDHWLSGAPQVADTLLAYVLLRADERIRRKQEKETGRKSATRKLRLPGKLTDCANSGTAGTELYIVEGDSAGGSAKMARDRANQAVLPLRGKILNVASAGQDKTAANQELKDLLQALGCGTDSHYREADLRYDKVIIMTDADVDGAHIATLLMTFFYRSMPQMIREGHLYLAQPPLYRLTHKGTTIYAQTDAEKDRLVREVFKGSDKVDVGRFKGLGEMRPDQLKSTTMDPKTRTLLRVKIPEGYIEREETSDLVERLMGKRPELRFEFIQKFASTVSDIDV
jgi:topoisomerase-4 subunit B